MSRLADRAGAAVRKVRACRYCAAGNVPNGKGEHWIVKSVIPARLDIRRCTAAPADRVQP
jgi:hypothetical protein